MKLPANVSQSLAAAVALAGMAGCNFMSTPAPSQTPTSTDPNVTHNAAPPGEKQPEVCLPDACPACGRG